MALNNSYLHIVNPSPTCNNSILSQTIIVNSIDDVNDILQLNVIGAVPDDENIVVATNKGQPLVGDDSLAGQAYMNICRRITGEEIPFLDLNGKGGFFKKLSSLFKSDKKN